MNRIYKYELRNLNGDDVGCIIDLEKIIAIDFMPRGELSFDVHVQGRAKPISVIALNEGDRQRLVNAWIAYHNRKENP